MRLLIVDGYPEDARERHRAGFGLTPGEAYAAVVKRIVPAAACDIALPADADAQLPSGAGLSSYDAVILTGSPLHVYHDEAPVRRQIELMRAVYDSGVPSFGSCWGLQVAAVAAGGTVTPNPLGREVGFARRIMPSEAGRCHALLAGRPGAFDAPCVHLDVVASLPANAIVLASNGMAGVQAAEIRHGRGVFWGVQYHPEFSLTELAAIMDRMAGPLTDEGFFRDPAEVAGYVGDLRALDADRSRRDLAWRHGLDEQVLVEALRTLEIRNFVARCRNGGTMRH